MSDSSQSLSSQSESSQSTSSVSTSSEHLTSSMGNGWHDVWPSWRHPKSGGLHWLDCYNACLERTVAGCGAGLPDRVDGWRCQRSRLQAVKNWLSSQLTGSWSSYWIDTDDGVDPNENGDFSRLTKAKALQKANLPENYFDYTPWRAVHGLGWDTTDASVGHPHGESNDYTQDGGTEYLPSGRTCWYTTDYSWDGCWKLLKMLKASTVRVDGNCWQNPDEGQNNSYHWEGNNWAGSWQGAIDDLNSKSATPAISLPSVPGSYYRGTNYFVWDWFIAFAAQIKGRLAVSPGYNGIRRQLGYWFRVETYPYSFESVFDGQGADTWAAGQIIPIGWSSYTHDETIYSDVVLPTGWGNIPPHVPKNPATTVDSLSSSGWRASQTDLPCAARWEFDFT